jgi:DNA-binding MarR family transcriptional regulator
MPMPAAPEDVTELILRIFRANSALLAAGDQLVEGLGLTSARWQLLGGIADHEEPLSVAQLAREIGVTRQSVQRIANELESEGVIVFRPNPRHKRAQLVELTSHGRTLFERSMELQRPWATALGRNLTTSQVSEACKALGALLTALKGSREATAAATDAEFLPGRP